MSEFAREPEAKTPYDAAIDGFFGLLDRNAASEMSIRMALANLLAATSGNGIDHNVYLDNWSQRHTYDARGILVDNDGYDDDRSGTEGHETTELISRKLAFLADVGAFLIASPHSLLTNGQKESLMYKVGAFFDQQKRHYELADTFGTAIAPYVAHDIDMIEFASHNGDFTSDDRMARIARGRFVIRIVDRPPYMRGSTGRVLSGGLRRAARN
jgi:hypothetical protein